MSRITHCSGECGMRGQRVWIILLAAMLLHHGSPKLAAANVTVTMGNFFFNPPVVTINVGDTVTWVNPSFVQHDATPGTHATYSGAAPWVNVAPGESQSFTFTQPGVFPYLCVFHFNRLQQTGTVTVVAANLPPTVQISSPAAGATLVAPASFNFAAQATDPDGTVTSVQFFINGMPAGTATGPAFSVSVNDLSPGTYTLTATATDNQGASSPAEPIEVTVIDLPTGVPLTVVIDPPNGGSVALDPPQPPEGYVARTQVTLTALTNTGSVFLGWSGDVSGEQSPITVTMDSAKTVIARFATSATNTFTLILATNPPAGGVVHAVPAPLDEHGTYLAGTVVTLTATAVGTNRFVEWSGAMASSSNQIVLTMDSDKFVAAQFVPVLPVRFALTTTVIPSNSGVVLTTPAPDSAGTYAAGTTVALAAQPGAGYRFARWIGAPFTNNPLLVVMNSDQTLTAVFDPLPSLDFAAAHGTYAGPIMDEHVVDFARSGFLSVRVRRNGRFVVTGSLGGIRTAAKGRFDRLGYAPLHLRRGSLHGSLQIDEMARQISGNISDGPSTLSMVLERAGPKTNESSVVQSVGLIIEPQAPFLSHGSATLKILRSGAVQMSGRLGDGTTFSDSSFLTTNHRIPVFAALYQNRGALLGWLTLDPDRSPHGSLHWMRPPDSRQWNFPEGFAVKAFVSSGENMTH